MYDSKKRLEQHVASVHDPASANFTAERLRCGACRLAFTEKKYFDMHLKIYHQRKPQRLKNLTDRLQVCERCVTTFESREALQEHVRQVHKTDQPLRSCECPKCGKDLKTTTLLRTHILVVHLGHLPFVCQHCEAAFSTRHWLLKHIEKDHAEAAAAATALEGTDFIVISQPTPATPPPPPPPPPTTMIEAQPGPTSAAIAVSDEPTPNPPMPLKCSACEEYFDDSEKLSVHVTLVHAAVQPKIIVDPESGQSRFACGKCEKQYTSRDELEKHVLKAHPTFMLMYKCPLCVKPIRYRKQHMRVHHDTEYNPKEHHYQTRYKCHCCSKLFKSKRNLTSHQNTLLFQCDKCHMRFKTKKSFQSHAAVHRANKSMLKCADCGLEFGYRARMEEHRSRYHSSNSTEVLKLLNCPYCPRLFISASNRERHVTINHPQSGFIVSCGHCENMRSADSAEIRRHYREVHPNERVTFKCAECVNRIYLNFSSYKDHYKAKHAAGAVANGQSSCEQSFSGESSSAAETSFNDGTQIKQEAEDTKLVEDSAAVKIEPPPSKEEEVLVPKQEVSENVAIVQEENKEPPVEATLESAEIEPAKPPEEEPDTDEKNIHSLPQPVEMTNESETLYDKDEDSKNPEKDVSVVEDPVVEIEANQTEDNPIKLEDKPEVDISTPEEIHPSANVEEPELAKKEPEASSPTEMKVPSPAPSTNIDEPIPADLEHEPEVDPAVAPPVETKTEPNPEAKIEPVADVADVQKEETGENSILEVPPTNPDEPPSAVNKPEPKVPEVEPLPEETAKSEPEIQPPIAEVPAKVDEDDDSGAKSAKRARKDSTGGDGDGGGSSKAEVVDSDRNNGSFVDLMKDKPQDLKKDESDKVKPPAKKRGRPKIIRSATPAKNVQQEKHQERSEDAAQREPDLKTAVIILSKIQLPDCEIETPPKLELNHDELSTDANMSMIQREAQSILDAEPKLELFDCYVGPNPKLDAIPVLETADCSEVFESSSTKPNQAVCAVSLTRLDEEIFPPLRNHEIPLEKCVVNGAAQRHLKDAGVQPIPRKKPKLALEKNGRRRFIARFLTCKRCGEEIPRTSFSAHRNSCPKLQDG